MQNAVHEAIFCFWKKIELYYWLLFYKEYSGWISGAHDDIIKWKHFPR